MPSHIPSPQADDGITREPSPLGKHRARGRLTRLSRVSLKGVPQGQFQIGVMNILSGVARVLLC